MRRILLVILGIVLALIIAVLWWLFRDTPEKVLRDGLKNLLAAQSVEQITWEVAWSDPQTRITTGVNFAGQVNAKDMARPQFLGVVELGDGVAVGAQIADLVLISDKIAVRPRRVTAEYLSQYKILSGDTENKNFIYFSRDKLLSDQKLDHFTAQGEPSEIRIQASAFSGAVSVAGDWKKQRAVYFGLRKISARLATVPFRINESTMRSTLTSFLKTWRDVKLAPADLQWINRSSQGLARGLFSLTVDQSSRLPVSLEGEWPVLDDQEHELFRVRVKLALQGLNQPVNIALPENAKDATKTILKTSPSKAALPSASARTGSSTGVEIPFGSPTTLDSSIVFDTSTREYVDVENIDLWHKYMEELKKKKEQ
jgi:hypothetical protein